MAREVKPGIPGRRIVILASSARNLLRARSSLLAALLERRHHVLALAPDLDEAGRGRLTELGAEARAVDIESRGGIAFLPQRRAIDGLARQLADWRPHAILLCGLPALPVGVRAAERAKVPRIVALITGLGEPEAAGSFAPGWRSRITLRPALSACHAVVCHNAPDRARLAEAGYLTEEMAVEVVPGAGVDLARYPAQPLPPLADGLIFGMVAPLVRSKGVLEFCEAARIVRARSADARFVLAAGAATGAEAIEPSQLARHSPYVTIVPEPDNVAPLLASWHVVVLPTYTEGMPPVILQALASGRPVITSDVPGCRDTVDERVNGVLIAPREAGQLAAAIEGFLKRPDLMAWMSRASRLKAERRFDARAVNGRLMTLLGLG